MKVLVAVVAILFPTTLFAQSNWDHNGSVVTLYANGASRQFLYSVPRAGLPVTSGTVLFNGTKSGDSYSGTAYAFSSRCGNVTYTVSGPVSADQRSVTMYGKKPRRNAACRVVDYEDDALVFNFQEPGSNIVTEESESNETVNICIHPVFLEENRLRSMVDGNPSTTEQIAAAINHIRAKYCREIQGKPTDDIRQVQVAETCFQYSGLYRGERVYWGRCHE